MVKLIESFEDDGEAEQWNHFPVIAEWVVPIGKSDSGSESCLLNSGFDEDGVEGDHQVDEGDGWRGGETVHLGTGHRLMV